MVDIAVFEKKARNYFTLGLYAEKHGMGSEAVSNFFKALFALCDMLIFKQRGIIANDHTERFRLLKRIDLQVYRILDELFSIYRETYTKELSPARVDHIKARISEVFEHAKIEKPTEKDL